MVKADRGGAVFTESFEEAFDGTGINHVTVNLGLSLADLVNNRKKSIESVLEILETFHHLFDDVMTVAAKIEECGAQAILCELGQAYQIAEVGSVSSEVLFVASIKLKQSEARCWGLLAAKNAVERKWKESLYCTKIQISKSSEDFFTLSRLCTTNFILGEKDEALESLAKVKKLATSSDLQKRLLPLEVIAAYVENTLVEMSLLKKLKIRKETPELPKWLIDTYYIAFVGAVKSTPELAKASAYNVEYVHGLLPFTETPTKTRAELVLTYPDQSDDPLEILKSQLSENSPNINSDVLAIIEGVPHKSVDEVSVLLASYVLQGRDTEAYRVLKESGADPEIISAALNFGPDSIRKEEWPLNLLRQAHHEVPNDKYLAKRLAINAFHSGDPGAVVAALKEIYEKGEKGALNSDELYALGVSLQMTNRPAEAVEVLSKLDVFDDNFLETQYLRQKIFYQLGEFKKCVSLATNVLSGNPKDLFSLKYLVLANRALAKYKDAAKVGMLLATIDGHLSVNSFDDLMGAFEDAVLSSDQNLIEKITNEILTLRKPGLLNWSQNLRLINLYIAAGDYQEALIITKQLLAKSPYSKPVGMLKSYLISALSEDAVDAGLNFESKSEASNLTDCDSLIAIAINFLTIGEFKKAHELLEKATELSPYDKLIQDLLAKASIGREAEAVSGDMKRIDVGSVRTGSSSNVSASLDLDVPKEFGPAITVVVPCYNEARFLNDCLSSILGQDYPFWECIVVDDLGDDTSSKIAKAYEKADKRFRYIRHKKNKGLAGSRNTGLRAAKSQLVTFLDGDDFLTKDSLRARIETLNAIDSEFVGGVYCFIEPCAEDRTRSVTPKQAKKAGLKTRDYASSGFEAPFNAHSPIVKKSILLAIDGFDETMKHGAEDWDCWQRIMRLGYSFKVCPITGGFYRQKRGSMVRALSKFHVREAQRLYNNVAVKTELPDVGPYSFKYPVWVYQAAERFYRRVLRFGAMSYLSGDMDGFEEIISKLPGSKNMCDALEISVPTYVRSGVDRFLSLSDEQIGGVNRSDFKKIKTAEISEIIVDMLESRHPDTNFESFMDRVSFSDFSDGQSAHAKPIVGVETESIGVPKYVRLEEPKFNLGNMNRLKGLHNIHAGKRVFIVGNGPSLNNTDLTKLNDEYSIAVNGIFYKTREMGYRPTYYVVEDSSVMRENIEEIKAYEVEKKFFPTIYSNIHPAEDETYFFRMNRGFYEPQSPNYCVPRFSTDFSQRAFCGQSVTFINLQLAYYMGFSEVYLVGMDFSYIIPDEFERKGDIITSTGDDPNHFHPDYFGKGKTWKDPKLDRVFANYGMAKLAYETSGRKIYNATVGGKLELFERKDFESLF